MELITFKQIGVIRSPYKTKQETPIQAIRSTASGTVELFEEYLDGLLGLDEFSHIYLFYTWHQTDVVKLLIVDHNILTVRGIDVLDNTSLLDIKPYVPDFDHFTPDRIGWYGKRAYK